jgi:hypothetical protein
MRIKSQLRRTRRVVFSTTATIMAILGVTLAAAQTTSDGYPAGHYPIPHRMGQFDRLQLAAFEVVPEDQLVTMPYFGLRHTDTFLDVLLTGSSGKFYLISNVVRDDASGALTGAPWLGATESTPNGLVPDPRYQPWVGAASQLLTSGNKIEYSVQDTAQAEDFSFDEGSFEWKTANGNIHITGTNAGSGTSWRLPWREPEPPQGTGGTDEMFYNQQAYRVEGTYYGEHVKGHVVLETMWGTEDYASTWWVQNRIGHWAFVAVNYTDGSSEFGQILCGEYGARGAVISNDKGEAVINTTDVNAYDEGNGRILYDFGHGKKWEFIADPTRGFPLIGTTTLGIGFARPIDGERKIASADGVYLTAVRMCKPVSLDDDHGPH